MRFIPGLTLSEGYYREVVAPLMERFDSTLPYSAALMGYGSDVLGYDTATSMDHNWGPRLQVFLDNEDPIAELDRFFRRSLPKEFLGFPTNFSAPAVDGTQRMDGSSRGNHLIEIYALDPYCRNLFGADHRDLKPFDWLRVAEQSLVEATAGKVFHDGLGGLNAFREALAYYPVDVQKIRLAAYWNCIGNEEAFVGRAVETGDFLGLKLLSTRIANYLMKICFVVQQRYVPYSKWFSRAFSDLRLPDIEDRVRNVLVATDPYKIEDLVAELYRAVLDMQNRRADFPHVEAEIRQFHGRPYKVIMAESIVETLVRSIDDEELRGTHLSTVALDTKIDGDDFTEHAVLVGHFPKHPAP